MRETLRTYYRLTKPGIIYGNALTLTASFLFASKLHIYFGLLAAALCGSAFVIASACVINNVIDQGIDKRMQRTKKRALVTGKINSRAAITYGVILAAAGITLLASFTNRTTLIVGVIGFIDYVILYGITKRRSVHGTLVGCISGSTPIVAGYTAVTNRFDLTALLLGLIMVFWQLAHFYAIAMYRYEDYKAANLPVFPVVRGLSATKKYILFNILGFVLMCSLLTMVSHSNILFLGLVGSVTMYWAYIGLNKRTVFDTMNWGKQMFITSLFVICALSFSLPISSL